MGRFTQAIADEYRRLFDTAEIRAERQRAVERSADRALELKTRYQDIGGPLGIPWFFIAAAHMRESSYRTDRHLHNGDPLTARTVHVPAGRPPKGEPPFTFEQSATDALKFKSCMTLFEAVAEDPTLFAQALDAFYDGERDLTTLGMRG